jgi:hypothetical protein
VKTSIALTVAALALVAASAAPAAKPFVPQQEPRGIGNLVAPGDRVSLVYDAPGFNRLTGTVYVRNDLGPGYTALKLVHRSRPSSAIEARVPARLIRGSRLSYYAVVRDPAGKRSVRIPSRGTSSAWILEHAVRIALGTHRFGRTRSDGTVVAHAAADRVGWQIPPPDCGCGPSFGPETFLVARDGSVWLDDDLNNRLLGWSPGAPDSIVRTVPLPDNSADHDVALGPHGSFYVTGVTGHAATLRFVLHRLGPTGKRLWTSRLSGSAQDFGAFNLGWNSPLRTGADGTLYLLAGMNGRPGGEEGWMPVATPAGRALSPVAQRRGTSWPGQPLSGGRQLISEAYTARTDGPVSEVRYALIDRRGRLLRAWRVSSKTEFGFDYTAPELVGGDPVVVLDTYIPGKVEYVVLRLGPHGLRSRLTLARAVFGDNLLSDVRIGPDGRLYQLASSPTDGVTILRYPIAGGR